MLRLRILTGVVKTEMEDLYHWIYLLLPVLLDRYCVVGTTDVPIAGCTWRSSISSTMPFVQEARPWSSCEVGDIYWYYPKGFLRVEIRQDKYEDGRFTLCLQKLEATYLSSIYNQTSSLTTRTLLPLPTSDEETCIQSYRSKVIFLLESPLAEEERYLSKIRYHVEPP